MWRYVHSFRHSTGIGLTDRRMDPTIVLFSCMHGLRACYGIKWMNEWMNIALCMQRMLARAITLRRHDGHTLHRGNVRSRYVAVRRAPASKQFDCWYYPVLDNLHVVYRLVHSAYCTQPATVIASDNAYIAAYTLGWSVLTPVLRLAVTPIACSIYTTLLL